MILLRNKDQQQNNPLAAFATRLCRQRRGHERSTRSSMHDTITVNLTLVQCEFHTSVAIGNPELHVRKASHRGSKQQ